MSQTTLLLKKSVRGEFKGLKPSVVVALWVALVMTGLFLFCSETLAVIEDFDDYPLNTYLDIGTGNWQDVSTPMRVLDTQSVSEPHSGLNLWTSNYKYGNLSLTEEEVQELRFSIYLDLCPPGSPADFIFRDTTPTTFAGFKLEGPDGDECEIMGQKSGGIESLGNVALDTWTTWVFQQSVIEELSYVRYSINGGVDFSDWLAIPNGVVRDIDSFFIMSNAGNHFFVDDITGPAVCEIGNCHLCGWYGDCEEAGCFWYYSIYEPGGLWGGATGGWCIEPYEPEEEECGTLFKCQYCMSQETCEAENCIWEDRYGTGEQCYTPEPEIPPEQVGWEVPDLEECGELEGVEKWLCEIKNFVAGIFMPSQAKVNDLYYTIGAFKDRFPFSYVETLNRFFTEIETSFEEEKGIPITILGQESEVDFTFWDNTTTIGGEEETFKNVLFDFTSVMVILGWFLWLISVIRRFFQ